MGALIDRLVATAQTRDEWLTTSKPTPKGALSSPEYSLPKRWRKRIPGVLEKEILAAFIKRLTADGFAHVRLQVQGVIQRKADGSACMRGSTMTGMPDVIAMKAGKFYMFEVKAPGGKVSGAQIGRLKEWAAQGAKAYIVVNASGQASGEFVEGIEVIG